MAKNLIQGFSSFIERLVPLTTEHQKATSHKNSVKSCLENNFSCYSFLETGSFGNGTGVRHFSDTDYFAVCPEANMLNDSRTSLRKVKESLQGTFWQTEGIEVSTPSVKIPFGVYASETLEVTPATYCGQVSTPVGIRNSYEIPNFNAGWMKSSPTAHNAYVDRENDRLGGKLKPLIQLVKAWKFYNNVPISSFYLELRVTKYAEGESTIIYDIDIKYIMKLLNEINLASIIDPMGISGYVEACSTEVKKEDALSKLYTGLRRAKNAYEVRESNIDKCFEWWDLFFNGKFPSRF